MGPNKGQENTRLGRILEPLSLPASPGPRHPPLYVLGIESSCDETGVALVHSARGLIAHALHSQVDMHAAYGGVVPELASRDPDRC